MTTSSLSCLKPTQLTETTPHNLSPPEENMLATTAIHVTKVTLFFVGCNVAKSNSNLRKNSQAKPKRAEAVH